MYQQGVCQSRWDVVVGPQAAPSGCLACTSLENTAQQTDPFGGIVQDPWRVKTGSIT